VPEFFVPRASGDERQAEEVWQAVFRFQQDQTGWLIEPRRIFRIDYTHDGQQMNAQVGERHPYGWAPDWDRPQGDDELERVEVILEASDNGPYLVCTENRGVARGEPILVGATEAYKVQYFDGFGEGGVE
jgi:hypothetical protein